MAEAAADYFADGAACGRLMGRWSVHAGAVFLDWLALPRGLRWLVYEAQANAVKGRAP